MENKITSMTEQELKSFIINLLLNESSREYFEIEDNKYQRTVSLYIDMINSAIELYNEQIGTGHSYIKLSRQTTSIIRMIQDLKNIKEEYIHRICKYFKSMYNLNINESEILIKYKDVVEPINLLVAKELSPDIIKYTDIDYNDITKAIIEQN